jgi:hypothetical protein
MPPTTELLSGGGITSLTFFLKFVSTAHTARITFHPHAQQKTHVAIPELQQMRQKENDLNPNRDEWMGTAEKLVN